MTLDILHQADAAKRLNHCAIAASDWLAGGCDVHDIPRPHIAALVAFTKEACLERLTQPAKSLEILGWLVSSSEGDDDFVNNPSALAGRHYKGDDPIPLGRFSIPQEHPAQRKPLTDEQKTELWQRMTDRHSISKYTAFTLIELVEHEATQKTKGQP